MTIKIKWYQDEIIDKVTNVLIEAEQELGNRWETAAKGSVGPGRGVLTGTYRRSLHRASPGYNFAADNVAPSANSPDRAGSGGEPERVGLKVVMMLGSGLAYAVYVEKMYEPVMRGFDQVAGMFPSILRRKASEAGFK